MREFVKHIHFVGIGGIGMSGIAEVLLDLGFTVSGSDINESKMLGKLRLAGAEIFIGHDSTHIKGADAVVYSSAVESSNCEYSAALENKIPLVPRAEMLGEIMRFKKGIAVAGTHGKTTTTSLVAAVLADAGVDPTFIVGGVVNSVDSNARLGAGEYLVAEADESDASFLHLQPQMAVITNIDRDHMETYDGDFARLKQAYLDFLHNLPFYGLAILCFDDPDVRDISTRLRKPFISYGFDEDVEYRAIKTRQEGRNSIFEVIRYGESIGEFRVSMPGCHNVLNALAAIVIGYKLELEPECLRLALSEFQGVGRRFEFLGKIKLHQSDDPHDHGHEVELVDDYAHHPTEIEATLKASEDCWKDKSLTVVFQPHRYSRTRDLFDDFVHLLAGVENLIVTEVYPAGEPPIAGSDGRSLCRAIRKRGKDPVFVETLESLEEILPELTRDTDILLTLGAGTIGRFAWSLADRFGCIEKGGRSDS